MKELDNLQQLDSSQQSTTVHHFYRQLMATKHCDQYIKEFKPVREELFEKLSKGSPPGVLARLEARKLTDDDREAITETYRDWSDWLKKSVQDALYKHDRLSYIYHTLEWNSVITIGIIAERVADYARRYRKRP